MKNITYILIIALLAVSLLAPIYVASHQDKVFSTPATVCEITADCVVLEDASGDLWVWELEEGDAFELGQTVRIVFDDMGTADIYDDEIVKIF